MTTSNNNKPTNGWDALVKIVEMLLEAIACLVLLILCTPFGWIAMFLCAMTFIAHHTPPLPPHS